jgi:hypothetical protein
MPHFLKCAIGNKIRSSKFAGQINLENVFIALFWKFIDKLSYKSSEKFCMNKQI